MAYMTSRNSLPGSFMEVVNADLTEELNPTYLQCRVGFPCHPVSHQNGGDAGNNTPGKSLENAPRMRFSKI